MVEHPRKPSKAVDWVVEGHLVIIAPDCQIPIGESSLVPIWRRPIWQCPLRGNGCGATLQDAMLYAFGLLDANLELPPDGPDWNVSECARLDGLPDYQIGPARLAPDWLQPARLKMLEASQG